VSEPVKFKVTVGFFDAQTRFFQHKIPSDIMEQIIDKCAEEVRGVKRLAPGETESYRGFTQYIRVQGTPFDLHVEYVRADRQAVFMYDDNIVGICNPEFLTSMCHSLETVLRLMKDDDVISFRVF
jgi:hypothetical protein